MENSINYVYFYLDPRKLCNFQYGDMYFNNEPFYVGEGINDRMYVHLKDKHKCEKVNTIQEIIKEGLMPIIIKWKENISEFDAKELEKYLIKLIGRKKLMIPIEYLV